MNVSAYELFRTTASSGAETEAPEYKSPTVFPGIDGLEINVGNIVAAIDVTVVAKVRVEGVEKIIPLVTFAASEKTRRIPSPPVADGGYGIFYSGASVAKDVYFRFYTESDRPEVRVTVEAAV